MKRVLRALITSLFLFMVAAAPVYAGTVINPFYATGGGGAAFSPDDVSGLELWLDAADSGTITESSGSVSQWDDKSTAGNDFTQGTGSAQPTTGSVTIGGVNAIDFDGSSEFLSAASAIISGSNSTEDFTIFIVSNIASGEAGYVFSNANGTGQGVGIYANTTPLYYLTDGTSVLGTDNISRSGGVEILMTQYADTNNVEFAVDGVAGGTNTRTYGWNPTSQNMVIGNRPAGSSAATYLDGAIGEILIYNRSDLTVTEKNNIGTYLASKWSGTWTGLSFNDYLPRPKYAANDNHQPAVNDNSVIFRKAM